MFETLYDDLRDNTKCSAVAFNSTCPDPENQRNCGTRDQVTAGQCTFRRWKEARRALGMYYWPWTCPEVDITSSPPTDADFEKCRDKSNGDVADLFNGDVDVKASRRRFRTDRPRRRRGAARGRAPAR